MLKTAFVVLALFALSACATVAPVDMLGAAAPVGRQFAETPPIPSDIAPAKAVIAIECTIEAPQEAASVASPVLSRRAFGHPTRHQPDLHLVLATAADRAHFRRGRRRARRA